VLAACDVVVVAGSAILVQSGADRLSAAFGDQNTGSQVIVAETAASNCDAAERRLNVVNKLICYAGFNKAFFIPA
jgi:hypothetical protein